MSSSDASLPCRLEWRRSRWLPVALCVLAVAAVAALWLSDMPRIACGIGSTCVIAYAGWLLYHESSRQDPVLSWLGGDAPWQVEGDGRTESMQFVGASFRGGLVVLALAEETGRARRYVWWPDTMDARGRRALRLAMRVETVVTPVQPKLAQ
jgi:toxin CptA